jgi:hypothetical protein
MRASAASERRTPAAWRGSSLWLSWAAVATIVAAIILMIPSHQDEFVMYHVLACFQPSQQFNTFTESCSNYPIQLGHWEFQRSWRYLGATSSMLLAPFQWAWSSLWTPYLWGVIALGLTAWGVTKSFRVPSRALPVFLLYFPLTFAILRDSGPVRLSMIALAWTPFLMLLVLRARRAAILWTVVLATLWILATEDKPFFLYLMPGAVVLTLAGFAVRDQLDCARQRWVRLTTVFGLAAAAPVALLVAARVDGQSYLAYLANSSPGQSAGSARDSLISGAFHLADWPYVGHRVTINTLDRPTGGDTTTTFLAHLPIGFGFASWISIALSIVITLAVLTLIVFSVRKLRRLDQANSVWWLLAASFTFFGFTVLAGGWALHHFVFTQLPLAIIVALAWSEFRKSHIVAVGSLLILGALSIIAILSTPSRQKTSNEIHHLMGSVLDAASDTIVIDCASWGCYHNYRIANYGDVPVVSAGTSAEARDLLRETAQGGKQLIHVCMYCSVSDVQDRFGVSQVRPLSDDTEVWQAYTVSP